MNYFEILGVKQEFDLNEKELDQQYLQLQKKYHPDLASNEAQKIEYMLLASDINTAYLALKDPYLRAAHILKLNNIDVTSEANTTYKISSEFLADILEKRESLENINNFDNLLQVLSKANIGKEEIIRKIRKFLKNNELEKVAIQTILLKYQNNYINAINQKLETCF